MTRRILITGASRGLGRAMTEGMIAAGHTVLGCTRNPAAAEELRRKFGSPHQFEVVDVTNAAQVKTWADKVLANGGPPDLLLNNAAVINRTAPLWQLEPDEFSQIVDINIKGVFHVVRYFVPAMVAAKKGVIVNFSSGWGRSVSPDVAAYCATKYAIEGLTLALAAELPAGMAAIPLNPGIINTEMLQSCFGENAAAYPTPAKWATKVVPFLLNLGEKDNGQSLSAPG